MNSFTLNSIYYPSNVLEVNANNLEEFIGMIGATSNNLYIPVKNWDPRIKIGSRIKFIGCGYDYTEWSIAQIGPGPLILLMPRKYLTDSNNNDIYFPMNSTATTGVSQNPLNPLYATTQGQEMSGYQGYWGSDMCQIYLPAIVNNLSQLLGDYIMNRSVMVSNSISASMDSTLINYSQETYYKGRATGFTTFSRKAILPSEIEVFGSSIFGTGYDNQPSSHNLSGPLPLFKFITVNGYADLTFFLRNVATYTDFGASYGNRSRVVSAASNRVLRPIITITNPN